MEMNDVELGLPTTHFVDQNDVARQMISEARQAQTLRSAGHEFRLGHGIAAREKRHIMSGVDQRLRQPGDDPLRAAIELRRDGFGEGGDLGDSHTHS